MKIKLKPSIPTFILSTHVYAINRDSTVIINSSSMKSVQRLKYLFTQQSNPLISLQNNVLCNIILKDIIYKIKYNMMC